MIFAIALCLITTHELCFAAPGEQKPSPNTYSGSHVFKESIPELSSRLDIVKRDRMHQDHSHEIVFAVKQRNMDELTRILHDVSDPTSDNYGHHLSRHEVVTLTSNPQACEAITKYLELSGVTVTSQTLGGEFIIAHAPIAVWEIMLNTEFHLFDIKNENNEIEEVVRTERYWIPNELDEHVDGLLNTVDMPLRSLRLNLEPQANINLQNHFHSQSFSTTPKKIREYYNMGTSKGSAASIQAIYAPQDQYLGPAEVIQFQKNNKLVVQAPIIVNGNADDSYCSKNPGRCTEGNLDVQYIMATSPESRTLFWRSTAGLHQWFESILQRTDDMPLVVSISYGTTEILTSETSANLFDQWAIKMGVRGITIFVASGDRGANEGDDCGYESAWPATSPYVTSVGATNVSMDSSRAMRYLLCDLNGVMMIKTDDNSDLHCQSTFKSTTLISIFT